jgi:glycine C-acetyltransferase
MTNDWLTEDLEGLAAKGLRRQLRVLAGSQGREIVVDGKTVLNFCSNDYLGLANDPRLVHAFQETTARYGMGAGASRLVCGNMHPHEDLESALADLKGLPAALLFNSGYAANTGTIPALFGREDIIFSDRLNHASIIDGILLSRAEFKRYPHVDMEALEQGLKSAGQFKRRLIVTDSIFSMDGDAAPLKAITDLARRYDAWVMVDEAHGFGVFGARGAGLAEELEVTNAIQIHMGTLSKAAGCCGAYVCGSGALREYLINHARSFIYSTALPPGLAASARKAIAIIGDPEEGRERRQALAANGSFVRAQLKGLGFDTMNSSTPIIPVLVKDSAKAVAMSRRLLEQGFFVQAIRPPTVPQHAARLRITVTAAHTQDDLKKIIAAMQRL